jgi:ABC-2 type transport system permease protein
MRLTKRTYYFIINEIRQLWKAPLPILLATVFPILAWIVLALTFQNSIVEKLPFTVVDMDNSALSRTAIKSLDATRYLALKKIVSNYDLAMEQFKNQEVYFIVSIPKDFEKNIKSGQSSEIPITVNGATMLYAKVGYKAFASTLSAVSAGIQIKRLEGKGLNSQDALAKSVPISTEINILGNPYMNYAIYLIPGMILSILQMSASFSTLWLFRQHRERQSARVVPRKGQLLPFAIGRLFPLILANIIAVISIYLIVFPIAGIPIGHSYINMCFLSILLAIVSMGMGALVSLTFGNLVTASQILLVINAPAFVFSGYTYPTWAMPVLLGAFSKLLPLTHFFDGFFPMLIYDASTNRGIIEMLIIGGVLWGLTFIISLLFSRVNFFRKLLTNKNT